MLPRGFSSSFGQAADRGHLRRRFDYLKEYGRLSELFGADANKAVTEADKVVREWGRLKEEDAKALADLMHDATLAKVDADPLMRKDARGRLDGIRTALDIADGKIAKARATVASAGARTARADAAYNKAQRAADKAAYALEKAQENTVGKFWRMRRICACAVCFMRIRRRSGR